MSIVTERANRLRDVRRVRADRHMHASGARSLEPAVRLAVGIAVVEAGALALHGAHQLHAPAPPRRGAARVLTHAVQARAVAWTVPRPPPPARRRRPRALATSAASTATSSTTSPAASTSTSTLGAPSPAPAVAPGSAPAAPSASASSTASHGFLLPADDAAVVVRNVPGIWRYSVTLDMNPISFRDGEHRQQQKRRAEHGSAAHCGLAIRSVLTSVVEPRVQGTSYVPFIYRRRRKADRSIRWCGLVANDEDS
jgi:hypothetical protein